MKKVLKRNVSLYKSFRDMPPKKARRVRFSPPKVLTVLGIVDFIGYTTTHGSKAVPYKHTFHPGSKPLLCADARSGKIFFVGGRYKFTGRGIVDLDVKRREIE